MSYIVELNSPLSWVRDKFRFHAGLKLTAPVIYEPKVNESVLNLVYQAPPSIYGSDDWNNYSIKQIESNNVLFGSVNQLEAHFNSITEVLENRLTETANKISFYENKIKATNTYLAKAGLTQYTITSNNSSLIDTNKSLYPVYPLMNWNDSEKAFKLQDTGSFSSIRTAGGTFTTNEIFDSTYPIAKEHNKVTSIIDGSKLTIWQAECHSVTPLYSNRNTTPWIVNNTNGAAIAMDFFFERPLLISELVLDSSSVKPQLLDNVRWKPAGLVNALNDSTVTGTTWTLGGSAIFGTNSGTSNSTGIILYYGYDDRNKEYYSTASQTFSCSGAYNTSAATVLTYPGSSYMNSSRYDFSFKLYGSGITVAAKVIWLNGANEAIKVDYKEFFTGGYYRQTGFSVFKPNGAVSGTIQFTTEAATFTGTGYIDDIELTVGEKVWSANKVLEDTTYVNLPLRATTSRMTLVFVQQNPINIVTAEEDKKFSLLDEIKINPSLIDLYAPKIPAASRSIFSYQFGFKEIDFRYREFIPRGAIISKPVDIRKEIRRMWLSVEEASNSTNALSFYIYPFADDLSKRITCEPFVIPHSASLKTIAYNGSGAIYEIYTNEEYDNGLYNTDSNVNKFLVNPIQQIDTYNGTARDGVLQLHKPLHFKKVQYNNIVNWLKDYSIESYSYDPNSAIVYGVSGTIRNTLQSYTFNDPGSSIPASSLVYRDGYIPIEVEVHTSRFSAYPDRAGAPNNILIIPVSGEVLTLANAEQQERTVEEYVIGFDDWYSSGDALTYGNLDTTGVINNIFYDKQLLTKLKFKEYEEQVLAKPQDKTNFKTKLLSVYEKLKANNQLPKTQNSVSATIVATRSLNVYKTKYSPIVTGKSGTHVNVYLRNIETQATTGLVKSDYVVNAKNGSITINSNKTIDLTTTEVLADYLHFVNPYLKDTEKYSTTTYDKPAEPDGFLTRNVTDYKNGTIPRLKPFQPDITRQDYYPVIEYYVTPNSELIFSRDFFAYGDLPAVIKTKYETLNIQPRFSVWALRTSDVRSPSIKALSLGFRSASPVLERSL